MSEGIASAARRRTRARREPLPAPMQARIDALEAELREARDREIAIAEVLGVINASPGDLAPVFTVMLEKAARLCGAGFGSLWLYDGDLFRAAAVHAVPAALADFVREPVFGRDSASLAGIVRGQKVVHVPDMAESDLYRAGNPVRRAYVDLGGARTLLSVALRKEDTLLGAFNIYRQEVRPFSDEEIRLVENFAAQAVIAMENARLITETREALEQQTATAEVLQVINSSPGDLTPVFAAMAERAARLCEADEAALRTFDGELLHLVAAHGEPSVFEGLLELGPSRMGPTSLYAGIAHGERIVHVDDVRETTTFRDNAPARRRLELRGVRTWLAVALHKDNRLLGVINVHRREVRPFSEKQISLLQNFAAQAVIAMENTRLITETREALEQQTATAEVLGVINSSPGDLAPVFNAMLEKALRLCGAHFGMMNTYDGERLHYAADHGVPAAYAEFRKRNPMKFGPGTGPARILAGEDVVHNIDLKAEEPYERGDPNRRGLVDLGGARSHVAVALRKDDALLGHIAIYRQEVRPFTEKQIGLLQNFAAQAVIAMENARLITETRQRTAELQESLEYQTATGDVLKVISRSVFDLQPVLDTVVETAARLCEAEKAILYRYEKDAYRFAAGYSNEPEYERLERETPIYPGEGTVAGRAALRKRAVQILDPLADPLYAAKEEARLGKVRSMIGVPLLREGSPIGVIALARERVEPFSERQIELVQTFADQAVIAMENARLITETREARDDAESALRDLKAAQANLIQAEKMASLGQLTAGIAHEIKNPLNFVNNFAGLSVELLDELKATPAIAAIDKDARAEIDDTIEMLTGNLEKIAEHGKRADGIVRSMLEHSRGVTGERREIDLNSLVDEALNLAYHGARAQDQDFNIALERDFGAGIAPIDLAPQEITRVCLNLFSNGFYAATKRARGSDDAKFTPVLNVATRDLGEAVEIRIRDNGIGIPAEVKDKLFQPFFTTKPTGEGTGLGLSISYDIVTQQHGGTIEVESEVGAFTGFTIRLPR